MTDPTDDDVRAAERVLRGIVRTALDRHACDRPGPLELADATDAVLAALEDEMPDEYDDLLASIHDRAARAAAQED